VSRPPARRRRRVLPTGPAQRARVLEVARAVFLRRGYRDATLSEICEEAAVGRATLYRYFDGKLDLLVALVDEIFARVERLVATQPLPPPPPPELPLRDALLTFSLERMRTNLEALFADEATLRLLVDMRGVDERIDRLIARIDQVILGSLEADLRAGQLIGALRPFDTRRVARFCLGGLQHLLLEELRDGRPLELDAIARLVVELELFGLVAAPSA
jgi:AcrR family transcriptional regulator